MSCRLRNGLLRILGILDSRYIFSLEQFAESLKKNVRFASISNLADFFEVHMFPSPFMETRKKHNKTTSKQNEPNSSLRFPCFSEAFASKS